MIDLSPGTFTASEGTLDSTGQGRKAARKTWQEKSASLTAAQAVNFSQFYGRGLTVQRPGARKIVLHTPIPLHGSPEVSMDNCGGKEEALLHVVPSYHTWAMGGVPIS